MSRLTNAPPHWRNGVDRLGRVKAELYGIKILLPYQKISPDSFRRILREGEDIDVEWYLQSSFSRRAASLRRERWSDRQRIIARLQEPMHRSLMEGSGAMECTIWMRFTGALTEFRTSCGDLETRIRAG